MYFDCFLLVFVTGINDLVYFLLVFVTGFNDLVYFSISICEWF